jgi:hypothetical protein
MFIIIDFYCYIMLSSNIGLIIDYCFAESLLLS